MAGRNLEFDATPSWSGYNYQGKVALYVVLDKICKLYEQGRMSEISNYSLELEWLEDFSIINKNQGNSIYESIHQVKALDTTQINDYGEAIFGLTAKVIEYNNIEEAYLHTWKSIDIAEDEWKGKVKELSENNLNKESQLNDLGRLLTNDDELRAIYKRILKPKQGQVPDKIKRIISNIAGDISIDNIKKAIFKSIEYANQDIEMFKSKLTNECLDKINIFKYNDKNYCDLDEIKNQILNKIDIHIGLQGGDWRNTDSNYKEIIYHYLIGVIDKNVLARHKSYSEISKITIPLQDFNYILCNHDLDKHSKEYYLFYLKDKLFSLNDEYCKHCSRKDSNNKACETCNLVNTIDDINNMDTETFEKFCRVLCPNIIGSMDKIEVFQKMLESTGVNGCFFKALRDIKKQYEVNNQLIKYKSPENKTLLLTALADNSLDNSSSYACINMIQNREIDGIFMEVDEIINKDFDESSIWECANRIGPIDNMFDKDTDITNNIMNCKNVSIKPVADVIRRLNEDD